MFVTTVVEKSRGRKEKERRDSREVRERKKGVRIYKKHERRKTGKVKVVS
jgi:hypothetical protein